MKKLILSTVATLAISASAAVAGNLSIVDQWGIGNAQGTFQSGDFNISGTGQYGGANGSMTIQNGLGNVAGTLQDGTFNSSLTNQWGGGNAAVTMQFGNNGHVSETVQEGLGNVSLTVQTD
ncbi:MAG: hypothetical protein P8X76_11685 [Maritimibacter sp.]